jgi:hypothetical protein
VNKEILNHFSFFKKKIVGAWPSLFEARIIYCETICWGLALAKINGGIFVCFLVAFAT